MSAGPPLLETGSLRLRVAGRTLLDGLAVQVEPGQLWCVLGPNGSGKTTLLRTLAGLRAPDGGSVRLRGRAVHEWPPGQAACLRGFLPQTLHDAFGASALEVVLMGRHPHLSRWEWESDDDRRIAHAALQAMDLDALAGRDVTTLSGGERQRVGLAALLAQQPLALLLDEPIAHLDLHHQVSVLEHLHRLVREQPCAVVMSIHDLSLAHRFATHAVLLGPGGAALHGRTDEVMTAEHLAAAFGHPVQVIRVDGRTLFVAA